MLAYLGHSVISLVYPDNQLLSELVKLRNRIRTFKNSSINSFLFISRMRKILDETNPEIVLAHSPETLSLLRRAVTHIPVMVVANGKTKDMLAEADGIIVNNRVSLNELTRIYAHKKTYYVPPLLDIYGIEGFSRQINDIFTIGAICEFRVDEGAEIFIRSLAALRAKGIKFKAVIYGSGPDEYKMVHMIRFFKLDMMISINNKISNREKFYKEVDLLCFPGIYDDCIELLYEAMAYGLPIVATKTRGVEEFIDDSKTGCLVNKNDVNALSKKLLELSQNRDELDVLSNAAKAASEKNHDPQNISNYLEEAIGLLQDGFYL
jgi:glycosyltransferase involved in cell wall biosynthesis